MPQLGEVDVVPQDRHGPDRGVRQGVAGSPQGGPEVGPDAHLSHVAREGAHRCCSSATPAAHRARCSDCPLGRPRPGERVRLPALAASLDTMARDGFDAFYDGDIGERQARALGAAGSPITVDDLRAHTSTWGDPIGIEYRGVRATSHPPNSSGVVALEGPSASLRSSSHRPQGTSARPASPMRNPGNPPRAGGVQAGAGRSRRLPHGPRRP